MVSEYLTHLGYRVDTAPTGGEALEKVAKLGPELVVMDVVLPDGTGSNSSRGFERQRLRQRLSSAPQRSSGTSAHEPEPRMSTFLSQSRAT